MPQPRDLVARQTLIKMFQRVQQPIRRSFGIFNFMRGQELVFLFGSIFHLSEIDTIHVLSPNCSPKGWLLLDPAAIPNLDLYLQTRANP